MLIGFLVNPVAGMGGSVGLKGTDSRETQRLAALKGAKKTSPGRALRALARVKELGLEAEFLTCSGEMGAEELSAAGLTYRTVYEAPAETTALDSKEAVSRFLREKVDLILFAGGDGTARDVVDVADEKVPILGIPTGVKMHSAVFGVRPDEIASLVESFAESGATKEAEVMDIDEEAYRGGVLRAKLFGMAKVPDDQRYLQPSKAVYGTGSASDEAEELGQFVAESMENGVLYIIGPGSTTAAIARHLEEPKTILGVDVFLDKRVIAKDADEKELLDILKNGRKAVIVVSPIGSQGFIFGRGNQQISSRVIREVGTDNIQVVATPTKLAGTPLLRVDTGDPGLDGSLRGRMRVTTGYKRRRLAKVD